VPHCWSDFCEVSEAHFVVLLWHVISIMCNSYGLAVKKQSAHVISIMCNSYGLAVKKQSAHVISIMCNSYGLAVKKHNVQQLWACREEAKCTCY